MPTATDRATMIGVLPHLLLRDYRRFLDEAAPALGFTRIIEEDTDRRPWRLAWYAGRPGERATVMTVIARRVRTTNHEGRSRSRHVGVTEISMVPDLPGPLGCGLSVSADRRPPASVEDAVPPDHPAHRLPYAVRASFVQLTRPRTRRWNARARSLRITDRATLADYYPPGVHAAAPTVVIVESSPETGRIDDLRTDLARAAWMCWSLENSAPIPPTLRL